MAGHDRGFASKEQACVALRTSASSLGLEYTVVESIVFNPRLDSLKNNASRRFAIYQAMAQALGVVSK